MTPTSDDLARRRAERRRRVQQRQTVIFGSLIAGLLVVALIAAAMWTGMLPAPFTREFSAPDSEEDVVQVCPPPDTAPVPLTDITANVLNGTDRAGLAGATASRLVETGVVVNQEANYPGGYPGVTRIIAGPIGVAPAYTLARFFPGSEVILDDGRTNQTVDVVLGSEYTGMLTAEEISALDSEAPLEAPDGCTEVDLPEPGEGGRTEDPAEA